MKNNRATCIITDFESKSSLHTFNKQTGTSLSTPTLPETRTHSQTRHSAVATVTHSSPSTPGVSVTLAWWHVRQKGHSGKWIHGLDAPLPPPPLMLVLMKLNCGFQQVLADLNTTWTHWHSKTDRKKIKRLSRFFQTATTDIHHINMQLQNTLIFSELRKHSPPVLPLGKSVKLQKWTLGVKNFSKTQWSTGKEVLENNWLQNQITFL